MSCPHNALSEIRMIASTDQMSVLCVGANSDMMDELGHTKAAASSNVDPREISTQSWDLATSTKPYTVAIMIKETSSELDLCQLIRTTDMSAVIERKS